MSLGYYTLKDGLSTVSLPENKSQYQSDFNLFQPCIHHGHDGREPEEQFEIPYVSDYIISVPYLPYPY